MVHGLSRHLRRAICVAAISLAIPSLSVAQTVSAAAQDEAFETAALPAEPAPQAPGTHTRTRFVIGLDGETKFTVSALYHPNRVVIDLPNVRMQLPAQPTNGPVGLIKSFRGGLAAPGKSRIVIEVTEPVVVEASNIEKAADGKGHRLTIDIAPTSFFPAKDALKRIAKKPLPPPPYGLGAGSLMPPLPRPAERPAIRAAKAFKPIIVIDPGHGGYDSGATKNGTVEKDVVLAFGKALRDKLEETGLYKVEMTRDKDVFVPLGDRVSFAEHHKANLFIAIHADYSDSGSRARGATIYSLRDSVANALRKRAKNTIAERVLSSTEIAKLKKTSADVDAVKDILADLAERDVDATSERTTFFAKSVIETMGASTDMRNDPDQQASFRVLKTAQFPSVLIELAYVTNKQDARNLRSDTWRDKVAESIVTAVENYFSNQVARLPM
jgi:N-acetylmuramoyl-L-alanine amidase